MSRSLFCSIKLSMESLNAAEQDGLESILFWSLDRFIKIMIVRKLQKKFIDVDLSRISENVFFGVITSFISSNKIWIEFFLSQRIIRLRNHWFWYLHQKRDSLKIPTIAIGTDFYFENQICFCQLPHIGYIRWKTQSKASNK